MCYNLCNAKDFGFQVFFGLSYSMAYNKDHEGLGFLALKFHPKTSQISTL